MGETDMNFLKKQQQKRLNYVYDAGGVKKCVIASGTFKAHKSSSTGLGLDWQVENR